MSSQPSVGAKIAAILREDAERAVPNDLSLLSSVHAMLEQRVNASSGDGITASPRQEQEASRAQSVQGRSRRYWNPALAATALLVSGSLLVGLLAFFNNGASGAKDGRNFLSNPSFEGGLGDWTLSLGMTGSVGIVPEYVAGIDTSVAHHGTASAYINSSVADPSNTASLGITLDPKPLLGKRVRFSAYVKTEGDQTFTGLYMVVPGKLPPELDDPDHGFKTSSESRVAMANLGDRPILGTTDWAEYSLVLDVPPDATKVYLNLTFGGIGRAWLDDTQLTIVGNNVPTTDVYRNSHPVNLDFENGLTGWIRGSVHPFDFVVGTDTTVYHGGKASGYIENTTASSHDYREYFDLHQVFNTSEYRGKRIRVSAYLKTQDMLDHAVFWVSVQDIAGLQASVAQTSQSQIKGTSDWQQYTLEVDVPQNAHDVYLSVGQYGAGKLWMDDLQLDVIGEASTTPTPAKR